MNNSLWLVLLLSMWLVQTYPGQALSQKDSLPARLIVPQLKLGAERTELYLEQLAGKRLGLVVNHSSRLTDRHLVDVLLAKNLSVTAIFAPEHGFRGTADAGHQLKNHTDPDTGLPVYSLYGKNKKPSAEQLSEVDMLIFDIQDVGVRFYTYISTLHYVMEAAAAHGKTVMVLDRPNPNGDYVDGPILEAEQRSFVGLHPIPIVHGLTVAELARMIKGEGWISGAESLDLRVIPMANYNHITRYHLPVKPSPNLPNRQAVRLYPSLGLFEGTQVSVARGTDFPFQAIGFPLPTAGSFTFKPQARPGALHPPYQNTLCYGRDLRQQRPVPYLNLEPLISFYQAYQKAFPEHAEDFFNPFFNRLAGTERLKAQILAGQSATRIRQSWQEDLQAYRQLRKTYLLYP